MLCQGKLHCQEIMTWALGSRHSPITPQFHDCGALFEGRSIGNGSLFGDNTKLLSVLFPWLPNYPTRMCPVMTRHILVLPRHKFYVLLYTPFGHVSYMPQACKNRTQNLGLGIIYHFLKKMNWGKGRQEEKDAHSCTVCNKNPLLT